MEETNIQIGGGRRLVLGFDAGCTTCSDLAARVEIAAGKRLEVRPLTDPLVKHWREQILGKDAPWAPTLIELGGKKPRAWIGVKLGARLLRSLGPVTTWRVMQALGDLDTPPQSLDSVRSGRVSRGHFLKGVGGAALAMSVLSGVGKFSPGAEAELAQGVSRSLKYTEVKGDELIQVARATARRKDAAGIMGEAWSSSLQGGRTVKANHKGQSVTAIEGARGQSSQGADKIPASDGRVAVKAGRHELEDGNSMLAVAYWDLNTDRVLLYHEFKEPVRDGDGRVKSRAALHRAKGENILIERLSVNGEPVVLHSAQGTSSITSRRVCSGCRSGGNQYFRSYYCASIKWGCLLVACAACIPACATLVGCFYCAGVQCQYAYFVACCRRKGRTCFYCRR